VKNDPSSPPTDASAIHSVTPSDIFSWPAPDIHLSQHSERTGIENNWFAVTGRVVAVKVEADGDLHIALSDATGDKQGIVVTEIPLGPQWCDIRTTVFSWSPTRFPFQTSSDRKGHRLIAHIEWSPDSKFLLFTTASSGGHQPWHAATFVFCRSDNSFREVEPATGTVVSSDFRFESPDVAVMLVQKGEEPEAGVKVPLAKTMQHMPAVK
jgi:hypothetical protein